MKKIIFLSLFLVLLFLPATSAPYGYYTEDIKSVSYQLRNVEDHAVLVSNIDNIIHGSGTYMKYKGYYIVITAKHITEKAQNKLMFIETQHGELTIATVIYEDPETDIGILTVKKLSTIKPRPLKLSVLEKSIGDKLYYAGYPGNHDVMSFEGYLSGFSKLKSDSKMILINYMLMYGFAWFGSSGSGVFDVNGNFVGVLFGIDFVFTGVLENIVWIAPSKSIDYNLLLKTLCSVKRKPTCIEVR